ncbi:chorismate synthase [Staphylococcus epidermidis]|nr:chorismate synthase [Staphylococcus epidermidis]
MELSEADIQFDLDRRRPGTSKFVTQRNEPDQVEILSGVYEGKTTGTPIALLIIPTSAAGLLQHRAELRPGHADYAYFQKYGIRDPRGGGRSSARLTAPTVARVLWPEVAQAKVWHRVPRLHDASGRAVPAFESWEHNPTTRFSRLWPM